MPADRGGRARSPRRHRLHRRNRDCQERRPYRWRQASVQRQSRQGRKLRQPCRSGLLRAGVRLPAGCSAIPSQGVGGESAASKKNHVPDDVVFKTKPQIALDLIDRAKGHGIRVMAWTADELYGRDGAFLDGLDERGEAFVVEVPPNAHAWLTKPKVLEKPAPNGLGRPRSRPRLPKRDRQPREVRNLARHSD